jgi:NTE family protein
MHRPDVLVLGAGGTIGAAWMGGVLAGIAEETGVDFREVEHFVGTSAGSMVAADLLAGVEPHAPDTLPDEALAAEQAAAPAGEPSPQASTGGNGSDDVEDAEAQLGVQAWLGALAARVGATVGNVAGPPLAPLALGALRPGGRLVRAAALARLPHPDAALDDLRERIERHGLRFDGRLRIACVERESGRRVLFGAPGAPAASVAEAVQASCTVPWLHRPVRIGEHEYVDGGVWSPTNLDAAPALRDTHVLCLAPLGGPLGSRLRHPAIRAAATASVTVEALALRRRGAVVQLVTPAPDAEGEHVRMTGYRQGRALARP